MKLLNNKIINKFLSFSYGSWIGILISLVTTPLITRILSPEIFGKVSMFQIGLNIIITLIVFGTDQSFVRFFYEENQDRRGALLYNCLKIPLILMIISIIIIIIFKNQISLLLFDEVNESFILIFIMSIVAQFINLFSNLVIRMKQESNRLSIMEIFSKVINFVLIINFFYVIKNKELVLPLAFLLMLTIVNIINILYDKEIWCIANITKKDTKYSKVEIVRYAWPLGITLLFTWLFQAVDRIAIRYWSTLEEVGLYAAASKITAILTIVQTSFSSFWVPVSHEKYLTESDNKEFFEKISKLVQFFMLSIAIFSILFKKVFLLLLGSKYIGAFYIMPFLIFIPVMFTISETTVLGVNFFKKPKLHIIISGITCLFNIIGNWFLVPKYGALGAGISTALSYILYFSLRTYFSFKYFKLNVGLERLYFLIILIFIYSFLPLIIKNDFIVTLIGIFILLITTAMYFKDFKKLYYR